MSTYTPIASVTLSSAQSSVTFSGIPQTYTDLVVVASMRSDTTTYNNMNFPQLRFNGDSTSGLYSVTNLFYRDTGSGSSATSTRSSSQNEINFGGIATTAMGSGIFSTYIFHLQNYANTSVNKTALSRISTGGNLTAMDDTGASVGLWRNTNAITSFSLTASSSGNFVSGSTFNLYGVANASITNTAKATGGDSVYTDGSYWYHIFRSSGTFTPTQALTADYLVVAGGGGGGGNPGLGYGGAGGGGAGGLRCTVTATGGGGSLESALSLTASTNYTVTVGAGGASATGNSNGSVGSNSVFSSITSTGGGFGSTQGSAGSTAGTGGSGGGGGHTRAGGAGTANQGYAGGNGNLSGVGAGGAGGGGAGAIGQDQQATSNGGNGGAGVATSISGTSTTYAGGGGGGYYYTGTTPGSGGSGGGGTGGNDGGAQATAGTANTGGGGGGAGGTQNGAQAASAGGNGGSGIVIVRYAV